MKDFLVSNEAMELRVQTLINSVKNQPFYDEQYHQSLLDVFSAKPDYLESVIKKMDELYGGIIPFLENVLNVDIQKLKDKYLD